MFAATCTTCTVYQLLWLELVTGVTKTAMGYEVRFVCPRCGATTATEFKRERVASRGDARPAANRWRRRVISCDDEGQSLERLSRPLPSRP